ncbi:GHMP kinase [bacterium]|nr:GHMP kinase [bacterium]
MNRFFSHGKLLITGEYLVLRGAEAFALPTKPGQSLVVRDSDSYGKLMWTAKDLKDEVWFVAELDVPTMAIVNSTDAEVAKTIQKLLIEARNQNPEFLAQNSGFEVETKLDFDRSWGLGSSSTLICNIAKWSETNAFALSDASLGGSGVDIAVGMVGSELIYSRPPAWDSFVYQPSFRDQLFFVYLGRKKNSRDAISSFKEKEVELSDIETCSELTRSIVGTDDFKEFQKLVSEHEQLISKVTGLNPVKTEHFKDYPFAIKSLGAWGGDFILVCAEDGSEQYFKNAGYSVVLSYKDLIKY